MSGCTFSKPLEINFPSLANPIVGILDLSFGTSGVTSVRVSTAPTGQEFISAMILQPDGKIVVGGRGLGAVNNDFTLARYTSAGALDPAFGSSGVVQTDLGGTHDTIYFLALQPDGKIIAAGGSGNCDVSQLVRYNSDGSLDNTFGTAGVSTATIANHCFQDIKLLSDGKFLVGGWRYVGAKTWVLAKFQSNGALDTTFGTNGVVNSTNFSSISNVTKVALQSDNKIIIAGGFWNVDHMNPTIARLNPNGSLDSSFGTGGVNTITMAGDAGANGLQIAADGKIILSVYVSDLAWVDSQLAMVRLTSTGSLDPTFGLNGITIINPGSYMDGPSNIEIQSDGNYVVGGYSCDQSYSICSFLVLRILPTGQLDATFGTNGIADLRIGSADSYANYVLIQPDGKIIVGGSSNAGGGVRNFTLARFK